MTAVLQHLGSTARVAVTPVSVGRLLPACDPAELPSARDLLLQSLLHLPRIADATGTVETAASYNEIERHAALRREELAPFAQLVARPAALPQLGELEVRVVGPALAAPIFDHLHYLRSYRPDSVAIAAIWNGRVVAICTISPLDIPAIAGNLPIATSDEAAVISRVFAFDWAPRNVISYLLSRVERVAAFPKDVRILVTYVNPNLGFTGASYRAANWRSIGCETGTRYAYLRGRYITDRALAALSEDELGNVEFSRMPLLPLRLYGRMLDRNWDGSDRREFTVSRQSPLATSSIVVRG